MSVFVNALCLINMSSMMYLFFVNSLISPIQRSINLPDRQIQKKMVWIEKDILLRTETPKPKTENIQYLEHLDRKKDKKKEETEMESKWNKNKIDQYVILLWSEEKSLLLYSCNNFVNIVIKTRQARTEHRKWSESIISIVTLMPSQDK